MIEVFLQYAYAMEFSRSLGIFIGLSSIDISMSLDLCNITEHLKDASINGRQILIIGLRILYEGALSWLIFLDIPSLYSNMLTCFA